ncbi:uncharacterized protein LOC109596047 isoform X2 [Aethina tumida]|uniref:uncharacterized protein LOC109596047 isoform X2 n=1 Tax=Aethina tumida TaxID=116153 RepID=UPI00214970BB|nr:uncharacterized protein LOC109596047 isoform X2 [Aethina tumida]
MLLSQSQSQSQSQTDEVLAPRYYPLALEPKSKWKKTKIKYRKLCFSNSQTKYGVKGKTIYSVIIKNSRCIKQDLKECDDHKHFLKLLDDIIPNAYFGSRSNRRRFYKVVAKILTQSQHECIYTSLLCENYNYEKILWLQDAPNVKKVFLHYNKRILDHVIKPLVSHFYHPSYSTKSYNVTFYKRRVWKKFYDKNIHIFLKQKNLIPVDSVDATPGFLRLIPKTNCETLECRPIIMHPKSQYIDQNYIKGLRKKIYAIANNNFCHGDLYQSWITFVNKYISKGDIIYGMKLDIKDAFGIIDIEELLLMIDATDLDDFDKDYINKTLNSRYVTRKTNKGRVQYYKWTRGLVQESLPKDKIFMHRTVDDYIFCSPVRLLAHKFESIILADYKVNESKKLFIISNRDYPVIPYNGHLFNVLTGEIRKYYKIQDSTMKDRIKLWNLKRQVVQNKNIILLQRAMLFSYNRHAFHKLELSTHFNSLKTVLKNVFDGFVFIALKFQTIVLILKDYNPDSSFFESSLLDVLRTYTKKIFFRIQNGKGPLYEELKYSLIVGVACRAFILVFRKKNVFFKDAISLLKRPNSICKDVNNKIYLGSNKTTYFDKIPEYFDKIPQPRVKIR